jgi:hypothetical protein
MREEIALFLFLLVIVSLIFLFYNMPPNTNEGFDNHKKFVIRQHKQFNDIGLSLGIKKNEGVLGRTANDILNTFQFPNNTPLNDKRDGLWASIDKCEAVKTMDCNAFDDPEFEKICGICLDIGKNSDSVPATGGMVLLSEDKKLAKESASSNYLPDYKPTVGFCPAGKMVSTKAECLKLQRQLLCRKNSSYNLEGCSQCYSDTTYSIVDPKTSPGVVTGSGEILIVGRGILTISEQGFAARPGIKLHATTPYKVNIKGKEANRIKFTLEAAPVSDDEDVDVPYIAGLLNGNTGSGTFSSDLRRIVLVDEVTGRKPRSYGKDTVDNVTVTKMAPGFEKDKALIVVIIPFTFVETTMEESSKCKDGPFVTTQAAAEFLESDPCYKKGSGPGKFSLECLQGIWDDNGCNGSGTGYPGSATGAAALMTGKDGSFLALNDIADFIYNKAIITSTGVDGSGKTQAMKDWSEASVFCTGREITSPCDTPDKNRGPLSPECIIHLWNNQSSKKTWQGKDDPIGPTYNPSNAVSLFREGPVERSCQTTGTLSPIDPTGKKNRSVIRYWQSQGGLNKVKRVMADLHRAANAQMVADDQLAPYFKQCYGDVPFAPRPPTVFKIPNNKLPSTYTITRGNVLLESLTMTQDYKLQFVITPRAINSEWNNIIHFTSSGQDNGVFGSRTPAIWFWPGGLRLHVRIASYYEYNWGVDIDGCEIGKESMFSLECRGTTVRLTLDGKVISATHPDWRYSGNVKVYGSNPLNIASAADIKDVGLQLFGNSIKADDRQNMTFNNININGGGASVNSLIGHFPTLDACSEAARKAQPQGNYAVTWTPEESWGKRGPCYVIGPTDPYDRHFNPARGWMSRYFRAAGQVLPGIPGVKRVQLAGGFGTCLNFSQLVVLNEKGENISKGRPTEGSGQWEPASNSAKAVDGEEWPRGHPNEYHCSAAACGANINHWQVTLDNPSTVSAIIIYNRADCCQDRLAKQNMHFFNSANEMIYWKPSMGTALINVLPTNNSTNQNEQVRGKGANLYCYSNRYRDLYNAFDAPYGPGNNGNALMNHWNTMGKNEGRKIDC